MWGGSAHAAGANLDGLLVSSVPTSFPNITSYAVSNDSFDPL